MSAPYPTRALVSAGPLELEADADFARLPDASYSWPEVAGVAIDAADLVYVFNRGAYPVVVLNRDGSFLRAFGRGQIVRAHGITIGPDGAVWCVDDLDHTIKVFSPEGQLQRQLGSSGQPSDTGATSIDFRTIRRSAGPFHYPTNLAFNEAGDYFVADGYGNARIHHFLHSGELVRSWGEPGFEPGQFRVPHGIAVARDGTVLVADRENSRLQLFTPQGELAGVWDDLARPCQVALDGEGNVYVAELGYRAGMWPGTVAPSADATGGRVSVLTRDGRLIARFGGGDHPLAAGDFFAPHDIRVDSQGDFYVAEVIYSAGANKGAVPLTCHALQKFTRRGSTSLPHG